MKRLFCIIFTLLFLIATFFHVNAEKASETEPEDGVVLYENDFSDGVPEDFRFPDGHKDKVYAEDGFLYLNAKGREFTRVFLPEYLDKYGDYEITVHATILEPEDQGRWGSVIYRAQNLKCPYYQMCFRYNSTLANGVEFALRSEKDAWDVRTKGPSDGHIFSADTLDEIKVRISGDHAVHSINGDPAVDCKDAAEYSTGGIGLQANKSILKVDDIKVTYIKAKKTASNVFVEIAQGDLGVIGGYTLSEYYGERSPEKLVSEAIPANVIMRVNNDLDVVDEYGEKICSVDEAITSLEGKIMPTFRINDEASCAAVCGYLSDRDISDVFVMSEKDEIVKQARSTYKICRGVLDLTEELKDKKTLTEDELLAIRDRTNAAFASIVVIPDAAATTENVKYLYDRLIAVWVGAAETVQTAAQAFNIAAAGGHGAITDNTALMYDVIENYMSGKKLFRVPLNIGHRGIPVKAPENTVEGSLLAYELGADCIENDIYLTSDGQLAVMHDANTSRTTNGSLNMESSTLAQLKELTVKNPNSKKTEFNNVKIPSLQDYYDAFKGRDLQIFVEIKSTSTKTVDVLADMTVSNGMKNQVSVITFHDSQIRYMKTVFPEMSAGFLCNSIASGKNGAAQARSVLNRVQKLYSTYNPSYANHTDEYVVNANMRGLTTWPWTVDAKNDYIKLFMSGYNGITTNNCEIPSKWAKKLLPEKYEYEIFYGETHKVSAEMMNYKRDISDVSADVRVIPLSEGITVGEGNVLSFPAEGGSGKYYYALEYTYKINSKNSYTLYTQPILVSVSDPPSTEPVTTEEENAGTEEMTANKPSETTGENKNGKFPVAAFVSGIVANVIAVAILVFLIAKIKKRKNTP